MDPFSKLKESQVHYYLWSTDGLSFFFCRNNSHKQTLRDIQSSQVRQIEKLLTLGTCRDPVNLLSKTTFKHVSKAITKLLSQTVIKLLRKAFTNLIR